MPDMASLRLVDLPKLQDLPHSILLSIFLFLNTAQSVARLASTCRKLHRVIQASAWRIFVTRRFAALSLPQRIGDHEWMDLARKLTGQSRAWDRRAFSVASLVPPVKRPARRAHGHAGRWGMQTFPPQIFVDASSKFEGHTEEETVAWSAGEDVVVRWRERRHSSLSHEKWGTIEGAAAGFQSGIDDVIAISIQNTIATSPALLVGRTSGHLQLLSISPSNFGQSIARFQPPPAVAGTLVDQRDIQHFDTSIPQNTMVVVTKDNLLFYSLISTWSNPGHEELVVEPTESLDVRNMQNSQEFRLLQEARFMGNGDLALGMSSSSTPLRYLTRTPTGTVTTNAAKMQASRRCTESYIYSDGRPQTLRSILPVNQASAASGYGNVILSSYDDGTIRLQDIRSSSAIDTIYQDHFEVTTPVGPLVSYGMDRFIVGSARNSILKIFDFRWPRNYYYTDALPCSKVPLGPTPKPLTWLSPPQYPERESCRNISHQPCKLHALARTNFYRPNCNVYLPVFHQSASTSPIYSLSKPSDMSPVVYAGLAGELVKMSLRDDEADQLESSFMHRVGKKNRCGYGYRENSVSIVETSDGIALSDITKSQRVPAIYKQRGVLSPQCRRLDETLT